MLILFVGACTPTDPMKGYVNRKKDINESIPLGNEYYTRIQKQDFEGALELFTDSFLIPKDTMLVHYKKTYELCGNLTSVKFQVGHSFVRYGKFKSYVCTLDYFVDYEKCKGKRESLLFTKKDNQLKIKGHSF